VGVGVGGDGGGVGGAGVGGVGAGGGVGEWPLQSNPGTAHTALTPADRT
jgi:hypothetical protein